MTAQEHIKKLDKILKTTKFSAKTKALWAYYRGNESVDMFLKDADGDRVSALIILNAHLNGALEQRLFNFNYCGCGCTNSRKASLKELVERIRPTTHANWEHAVKLINIARSRENG